MENKRGFFSSHSKSSAAVATIIIHIVLVAIAFSFVAITVINREEVDFKAVDINRPKMQMKKLQVPVKMKQPKAPRLRKQIVVKPNLKQVTPEIKMPEIVGIKGGIGSSGSGTSLGGSLGFSMPEINFFGVKGKTERILLIIDGHRDMSADRLGGAYGYEVIKKECLHLIQSLPSTAVFNIIVYDGDKAQQLFPNMAPAVADHVQQAKDWLLPLNQVIGAKTKYGIGTLGKGGHGVGDHFPYGKFKDDLYYPRAWNLPVFAAMQQQADAVFLLTSSWGSFLYFKEDPKETQRAWYQTSEGKLYKERAAKGREMLDEENKRRKAAGEPPSALNRNSDRALVRHYFPGTREPPNPEHWDLGVEDFVDAFEDAYKAFAKNMPTLGIQKKKKSSFALNVVYFKSKDDKDVDSKEQSFMQLAKALNGEFRVMAGLEAIKDSVDPSSLEE